MAITWPLIMGTGCAAAEAEARIPEARKVRTQRMLRLCVFNLVCSLRFGGGKKCPKLS